MADMEPIGLVRLGDTGLTVADPAEDVRGRLVVDRDGEELGTVASLFIDEHESKVRLLEVESGGFLGLGAEARLLPVEAVTRVDDDAVHVDQTAETVRTAPVYDPALGDAASYYASVYGHFGYRPYWAPGAGFPPFPY